MEDGAVGCGDPPPWGEGWSEGKFFASFRSPGFVSAFSAVLLSRNLVVPMSCFPPEPRHSPLTAYFAYASKQSSPKKVLRTSFRSATQATDSTCNGCTAKRDRKSTRLNSSHD